MHNNNLTKSKTSQNFIMARAYALCTVSTSQIAMLLAHQPNKTLSDCFRALPLTNY